MTQLIYVADPMCSWCYGFGPELLAFLDTVPDAKIDLIMGGLRAYNKQVLDDATRTTIVGHWQQVAERSGLPFSDTTMSQPGFIYDTEPACRAVVTARTLTDDDTGQSALAVFHAVQHGFYAKGRDVSDPAVLSELAVTAMNKVEGEDSFDAASFAETLVSPMAMSDTREHFEQAKSWGIRGFPALLLVHDGALHMIASGYTTRDDLISTFQQLKQQ
ncbi:MAG: DsbA family protein [Burkholderiales bacterium]|nr:DsbA family protein [Burkholderiales bacterium]MBI3728978.1 DsbA family protein [Burkholderiales bacterium]